MAVQTDLARCDAGMWGARRLRLGKTRAAEIEIVGPPARKQTLTWYNGRESEVFVASGELAQPVSCSIRTLIGK